MWYTKRKNKASENWVTTCLNTSFGEGENKRIDRKKDKAIAKIDELYASGKSFETIQSEILANKHPDLTGKYIEQTTNYHAGKVSKISSNYNTLLQIITIWRIFFPL